MYTFYFLALCQRKRSTGGINARGRITEFYTAAGNPTHFCFHFRVLSDRSLFRPGARQPGVRVSSAVECPQQSASGICNRSRSTNCYSVPDNRTATEFSPLSHSAAVRIFNSVNAQIWIRPTGKDESAVDRKCCSPKERTPKCD